jgi:hypothetical protein
MSCHIYEYLLPKFSFSPVDCSISEHSMKFAAFLTVVKIDTDSFTRSASSLDEECGTAGAGFECWEAMCSLWQAQKGVSVVTLFSASRPQSDVLLRRYHAGYRDTYTSSRTHTDLVDLSLCMQSSYYKISSLKNHALEEFAVLPFFRYLIIFLKKSYISLYRLLLSYFTTSNVFLFQANRLKTCILWRIWPFARQRFGKHRFPLQRIRWSNRSHRFTHVSAATNINKNIPVTKGE